jgi:hypothetical protein
VKQRAIYDFPVTEFEAGYLLGLLIGEGHFGGDGRQAQITLRMHTRHARIFEWLTDRLPESRLYGPYSHGGRSYYQWMARGRFLRDELVPLLDHHLTPELDEWAFQRYTTMKARYGLGVARIRADAAEHGDPGVVVSDGDETEAFDLGEERG